MALNSWKKWLKETAYQQYSEKTAAVATVQAWMRQRLARHRVAGYQVFRSATIVQALWRGFYCRRMLTRARRFRLFNSAARMIQHNYRAYICRCSFAIMLRCHRAALMITQNLRRYSAKRRMFRSWCHRVARFHSAVMIQVWMQSTVARIRRGRARRAKYGSAALILQRFFRYTRFLLLFDGRIQRLIAKKMAAAVKLQKAYRAKIARARFYALKDQLEEQVRQRVLRDMWNNYYASSIQQWWRCRNNKRRLIEKATAIVLTDHSEKSDELSSSNDMDMPDLSC